MRQLNIWFLPYIEIGTRNLLKKNTAALLNEIEVNFIMRIVRNAEEPGFHAYCHAYSLKAPPSDVAQLEPKSDSGAF
jgi:hypothetical protein